VEGKQFLEIDGRAADRGDSGIRHRAFSVREENNDSGIVPDTKADSKARVGEAGSVESI